MPRPISQLEQQAVRRPPCHERRDPGDGIPRFIDPVIDGRE
jgi:hypothetical protein